MQIGPEVDNSTLDLPRTPNQQRGAIEPKDLFKLWQRRY
jgi:hypothetical protein